MPNGRVVHCLRIYAYAACLPLEEMGACGWWSWPVKRRSGIALFQVIPEVLIDQALVFEEGGHDVAGSSSTWCLSRSRLRHSFIPASAPCRAALAYSTKPEPGWPSSSALKIGVWPLIHHIHQLWRLQALGQGTHFFGMGDSLDKQDVGTGHDDTTARGGRGFELLFGVHDVFLILIAAGACL